MHEKALTNKAAALFPHFGRLEKFYLAGGTALGLQIGHRLSIDFDFFISEKLPPDLLPQVKRLFPGTSISVTYSTYEQLNILIDGIKTAFLYCPYPVIEPLASHQQVNVAGIREIAAMKAFSIGKRLSYKDYIDWYFLLKEDRVGLEEVIDLSAKKFGSDFNDRLFLGQLVSLEDIPTQEINFLRDPVSRTTVEDFFKTVLDKFNL